MADNDVRYLHKPENLVTVQVGQRVRLQLPHSEVCIHMRVAGTIMDVELLSRQSEGRTFYSAQLWRLDGRPFSAPITYGEAGLYREGETFHAYGQLVFRNGDRRNETGNVPEEDCERPASDFFREVPSI